MSMSVTGKIKFVIMLLAFFDKKGTSIKNKPLLSARQKPAYKINFISANLLPLSFDIISNSNF